MIKEDIYRMRGCLKLFEHPLIFLFYNHNLPIVNGKKVELIYNPKQFNVEFNTIDLGDIRFTKFWGTSLYKLSFTSKDLKLSDKYSFKLKY